MKRACILTLVSSIVVVASGCGGGSDLVVGHTPTPTQSRTATATQAPTPTRTPLSTSSLAGLVVVRDDVAPSASELGQPPSGWGKPADEASFDRSLAHADYSVAGTEKYGATTAQGDFVIPDLPPGRYTVELSKTIDGNLLPISVPVVVGDDGSSNVVVEVGMGLVRSTARYTDANRDLVEIHGPNATFVLLDGGRIAELGDASRTLHDADGDGQFDAGACDTTPKECGREQDFCADGSFCKCLSACPFCDNCEYPGICTQRRDHQPYRCSADGSCAVAGDHCVDTCPDCVDGGTKVCVADCAPVDIVSIRISGPSEIAIGRQAQLYATAQLSDGSVIDVTYLAEWTSANTASAQVDSWGRLTALAAGSTAITATLGDVSSTALALEVVPRPTLTRIHIQNTSCYCGPIYARPAAGSDATSLPPCYYVDPVPNAAPLPFAGCNDVVRIGADVQFNAIGEFADNTFEDLTASAVWSVTPAAVGDIDAGRFTARSPGEAAIHAAVGNVTSDAASIKVVTEASVESLSIYPANYGYDALAGGPVRPDGSGVPCFECGTSITVLRDDELKFQATAHYDTGEWRDVSGDVTWRSSATAVASIDSSGAMTALQAGDATIDAQLADQTSNPVTVRVVNDATLDSIYIYQEGTDRVVAKADQRFFRATGTYDIGISREITAQALWHSSDERVGGFDSPGVFTARAAGSVQVWAELDGKSSSPLSLEVYETSELSYCDPDNINRAVWSDDFNRVLLESDCRDYAAPAVVTLRYTVTETQPHGGIFDPCLDLYVYDGNVKVRTIREEGCGDPFLPSGAPGRDEAAIKYQLRAFWDLKDDDGLPVSPGTYTIFGRFYLYYDPVVRIQVNVSDSSATPRPTRPPIIATPTPTPAGERLAALSIGSAIGQPGSQVSFDVTIKTLGVPVVAVQNDIVFSGLAIDAADSGRPRCTLDPSIDKPQSTFAFIPNGCVPGMDCSAVRALILSTDDVNPLPDGAALYRCTISLPATANAGVYGLLCDNAVASDARGNSIPVRCAPGSVQVTGMSSAPPPSTTVEGACFLGSSDCSNGSAFPTAQDRCCSIAKGGVAVALSWCDAAQLDADGKCKACSNPCSGM